MRSIIDDLRRDGDAATADALEDVAGAFSPAGGMLREIAHAFRDEIDRGLRGEGSLKTLRTFTHLPLGRERGRFVTVDWGGTNARADLVELDGRGGHRILREDGFAFPEADKRAHTSRVFDRLAALVDAVTEGDRSNEYALGFIYSFPARLERLDCAIALPLTKGWDLEGHEGEDVVSLFRAALTRAGLSNVRIAAVANDTVATLALDTYRLRARAGATRYAAIGLILGTGTNQAAELPGAGIRNLESGNFDRLTGVQTRYDEALDREQQDPRPGAQLFEKLVAGQYLGEIARRVLVDLAARTPYFHRGAESRLDTPFTLDSALLSRAAADASGDGDSVSKVLEALALPAGALERRILQALAVLILRRSARLVGACLAGTLMKLDPALAHPHHIAIDGSLYGGAPGYPDHVHRTLEELLGPRVDVRVTLDFVKDSTSAGAAVIAAVAASAMPEAVRVLARAVRETALEADAGLDAVAGLLSRHVELRDPGVAAQAGTWLHDRLRADGAATIGSLGLSVAGATAAVRLMDLVACQGRVIRARPHFTRYEWAGTMLQSLHHLDHRASEQWPFFSGGGAIGPASIAGTAIEIDGRSTSPELTLDTLVTRVPEVLGPAGRDSRNGGEKYFFVKLLDPSDFPALAYVGFVPEAVGALDVSDAAFRQHVAELLSQDRRSVDTLQALIAGRVTSAQTFGELREAYKRWAVAEAVAGWAGEVSSQALSGFVEPSAVAELRWLLKGQCEIRRRIVSLLHVIECRDGEAIVVPSPTVHALAGLSGQLHPCSEGSYHPKDEIWMFQEVYDAAGRRAGWGIVEPQRSFDRTESGFDFFTPFVWSGDRLARRKALTQADLERFVSLMDATPRPRDHYVRRGTPMVADGSRSGGAVQWMSLIEQDERWPFFLVREVRFGAGGGTTTVPHARTCFVELHVTQGVVHVGFEPDGCAPDAVVSAGDPALVPATLASTAVRLQADRPARLFYVTRDGVGSPRAGGSPEDQGPISLLKGSG